MSFKHFERYVSTDLPLDCLAEPPSRVPAHRLRATGTGTITVRRHVDGALETLDALDGEQIDVEVDEVTSIDGVTAVTVFWPHP